MYNNSSLTRLDLERLQLIRLYFNVEFFSGICVAILCPITVVPNLILLTAICRDPCKCFRTPTTYFIVGLAVADLVTGLVVEPSFALHFILNYKRLQHGLLRSVARTLRIVAGGASTVAISTSYLLILGFSISQYIAVSFPHKYKTIVTKRNVILYVTLSWMYFIMFSLLKLTGITQKTFFKIDVALHPTFISLVLLAVNVLMYRAFRRHVRNQRKNLKLKTKSLNPPETPNSTIVSEEHSAICSTRGETELPLTIKMSRTERQKKARRQKKVERQLTLVVLHLATILLVSAFFHAVVFYIFLYKKPETFKEEVYVSIALRISDLMLFVKIALDAFVYAWRLPMYRQAIFRMLCCTGSNPQPPIIV